MLDREKDIFESANDTIMRVEISLQNARYDLRRRRILASNRPKNNKPRLQYHKLLGKQANLYGAFTQIRVGRLLSVLEKRGQIIWFRESVKHDQKDRSGIDFWGEAIVKGKKIPFSVDAKSSAKYIKDYQKERDVLIFIPMSYNTDSCEADRLYERMLKYATLDKNKEKV